MKIGPIFSAGVAAVILSTAQARASCGLQLCPVPVPVGAKDARFLLETAVNTTHFDIEGLSGDYTLVTPRLQYRGARFTLGAAVPFAAASAAGEDHAGLANSVVFGEYRLAEKPAFAVNAGLQAEIPVGDEEHGLASDHWELVPYASAGRHAGPFFLSATAGFRYALTSGHEHGAGPVLVVNPHEDKELLYRAGAAWHAKSPGIVPEIFVDGQHAFDGDAKGDGFLTGGVSFAVPVSARWRFTTLFEAPLASPRRIEWRAGFGAAASF